ncbi:putative recombination initiation defects 3 isoform X3 [Hevea brasiliensis]|uniref:putative recombination initiation defects 3 isoform X3 n=1 Tax=Hevea brasiliensis TaxID=3981 RepID=UPI0025D41FA2|nr:putative recombination initiation defects 3 isoform X3 [Hevea brasiliensis]
MKLKINKACDINSISVLPPQSRRLSTLPTGLQTSQLRPHPSQQSFSQGISSQPGMLSQLSQTSFDESLTNDQRFNLQERQNSVKKTACLPSVSYASEESQMPISRSTTNLLRKWNSVSVPDHKCQINEELEHRIGMVETSLNKFGMILGSVQSDVMQVNKGTKEVSLEMEGMRQKLIVLDTSLQLMATTCDLKTSSQNSPSITVLPPKVTGSYTTPQRKPEPLRNPAMPPMPCGQATVCPKIEMGAWNTVRPEQATFTQMASHMEQKSKRVSSFQKEKQCVIIESDEEIDGVFSCLIDDKKTGIGNYMIGEATEESERILRKARRRKRKHCNLIIIN